VTAKSGQDALNRADNYSSYDSGMCLAWVRGPCWDIGGLYASAIDAWDGAHKKHKGDRNPPDGAPCFYRGGSYGHIVIFRKHDSGKMRSTDCTYSGHVDNAALSWPESAWGHDYLGWTEDLNGVDLPLGGEDDDVLNGDDKDWIKGQIAASQQDIISRMNALMGDVVNHPTKENPDNTVTAKSALGMLLDRTD
jgi:hypothetical protein